MKKLIINNRLTIFIKDQPINEELSKIKNGTCFEKHATGKLLYTRC